MTRSHSGQSHVCPGDTLCDHRVDIQPRENADTRSEPIVPLYDAYVSSIQGGRWKERTSILEATINVRYIIDRQTHHLQSAYNSDHISHVAGLSVKALRFSDTKVV